MTTRDRERHTSAADTALFRYGTTVAAVASAGLARWLFDPLLGDNIPYATFFAAVALAAWVGGLRTGLLATGLGGVLALYAIVPPRLSFALPTGPHAVGLVMYLAVGLAISGFGEAMRVARRREAEHGERLRTTLSSIGDGVITTDTAGRVTNLNPVAEGLTGWTTVEATGQPLDVVFNIFNETTRQPVANPAFRALKEGVIVGLANHTILIARDGTERPIDDSAAPIRGRAGEVVGCVLVFRDVTDRRQAEVEQETARRQVETTLESITDGFMRFDRDWRVVYMNAEAERICQRPRSEVISQSHWEAFPATLGTRLEAEYRRAVADRVTVEFENFYEPWGRWFSIKGFPTPDGWLAVYFQDITARKRIEEELRHQTVMLRGVTDTTTDLIFVKDRDCRLTFANPACLTVLGMTERQALGVDPRTLYADPAEGEAIRATDERIMASGEDETVEEEYTGPLGTRTYSSKKTPLRDGTGAVVGVIGISRDITDRKGAEADLARERERLGLALHTGGLGVYEWRIGSDEVWWSPETFPVFGVDPATFRPTLVAFTALVHPDDRDALWRKTRECVERREVFDHEYRVVRPDGEVRWVYNRSHVAPGPGGEAGRITGVATDITDRKRAEERLRERERFVQRVLDASPGVVYVFDLARGGTAFINDRVRHALGVTPDEVIAAAGGFMAERVHPDDRDALAAHLAGLTGLADGAVCEVEYRMRHADGRW
ncbi:MAG: PAS domain-containing protein, partial [Gemmataceae bacterium]|nr:PAS domain-containing protein [Gemmataceae bacterium]